MAVNFSYYLPRAALKVFLLMALAVALLTCCVGGNEAEDKNNREALSASGVYVGDNKCISCHASYVKDHLETAHHFTSAWGSDSTIHGSFEAGANSYRYSPRLTVRMERKGDSLVQTAYLLNEPRESRAMSLVFGSGNKGQSFAAWRGDRLFQLPITYFAPAAQWSNSPGFPQKAVFNRPITARCLECHTTYVKQISAPGVEPESYDRNSFILTITCEKCHGPAAAHVAFHEKTPGDTAAYSIVNPALFTRQQKLDQCGLCHGGTLERRTPPFSFKPGDLLAGHFKMDSLPTNPLAMDVHGNQMGMMSASKCFTASNMTCNSCHDPHKNERGRLEVFSQRCLSCHGQQHQVSCKMSASMGAVIRKNCIDCHMPKEVSRSVAVQLQSNDVPTPAMMRSHFVRRGGSGE